VLALQRLLQRCSNLRRLAESPNRSGIAIVDRRPIDVPDRKSYPVARIRLALLSAATSNLTAHTTSHAPIDRRYRERRQDDHDASKHDDSLVLLRVASDSA
jgi:hypothetical protein